MRILLYVNRKDGMWWMDSDGVQVQSSYSALMPWRDVQANVAEAFGCEVGVDILSRNDAKRCEQCGDAVPAGQSCGCFDNGCQ